MADSLKQLERQVERDMELLRALPPAALRAEVLTRIQGSVRREAERIARMRNTLRGLRALAGAAAALLLALGISASITGRLAVVDNDHEVLVSDWTAAWEESTTRVAGLVEPGGADLPDGADAETELDDVLRSLDQSLERFESL